SKENSSFPIFAYMKNELMHALEQVYGKPVWVREVVPIGGGGINSALKASTSEGTIFVKYNNASKYPRMFEAEAKGLELLRKSGTLRIPTVYGVSEVQENAFLAMEFLQVGTMKEGYWEAFGKKLALLHANTAENFGLDGDNYIGSLPQCNDWQPEWPGFFGGMRLVPQWKMARDRGLLDSADGRYFEKLLGRLPMFFQEG